MKLLILPTFYLLTIFFTEARAAPPVISASTSTPWITLDADGPGYVSSTLDDPTDPSSFPNQFIFTVSDPDGAGGLLTAAVTNSHLATAAVSPVSQVSSGVFKLSITPLEVGVATIAFTVSNPASGSDSYVIHFSASAGSSTPDTSRYHTGAADGSSATAGTAGLMLAASGEDGFLRLYDVNQSGLPISAIAPPVGFNSGIEATFRVGSRLYCLGPAGAAFSTDLIGNSLVPVNQFGGLGAALALVVSNPQIGGAALAANGSTVFLGLRSPLQNSTGRAMVIPAGNLANTVDSGGSGLSIGAPIFLDLGGRSIRAMDTSASGQILILAGPANARVAAVPADTFKLFLWDGQSASPVALESEIDSIAAESGGDPESVFELPATLGNGSSFRVLSDFGGLTTSLKKFRSDVVTIYGIPAPPLVVTSAADSGPGSLRQTVATVPNDARIIFAPALAGQTISLTSGEIEILRNLTIDSSTLPAGVILSGNAASRVFQVITGRSLRLFSLTLTGGLANAGGAIYSEGNLTLENCTLTGNNAQNGGAIFANNPTGLKTRIHQSTLTGNAATLAGGAVYNDFGLMELSHCSVTANSAPPGQGAGIASFGMDDTQTRVTHSIVAGNFPSNADLVGGSFNSFQYSGSNLIATSAVPITPRLAPLGNYGGPSRTMPPLPDSPAKDAAIGSLTFTDQRGFARDALPDIGATELRGAPDFSLFWNLDFDGDGFPFGIEYALGTNPLLGDAASPKFPRLEDASSTSRKIRFSSGFNASPAGIRWVFKRSQNLISFNETLFTYDTTTDIESIHLPFISITRDGSSVQVTDTTPSRPRGFYRFEAELIAP